MRKMLIMLLGLSTLAGAQGVAPLSDADGDGLPWAVETALGTDPARPDSDGDGLLDGLEALCLSGDPMDPAVRKADAGVRLVAWREGAGAWVFVLTRGELRRIALEAVWGEPGPLRLERGLVQVAQGPGGVRTLALGFPADLLPALGGAVNFAAWAEERGGALHFGQGTLVQGPMGWRFLEARDPRRARTIPAERGSAAPFPVPAQTPTRTCVQVLERVGAPGTSWVQVIVTEEFCGLSGPFCVLDCGVMLGRTFPWRRDGSGQHFPG